KGLAGRPVLLRPVGAVVALSHGGAPRGGRWGAGPGRGSLRVKTRLRAVPGTGDGRSPADVVLLRGGAGPAAELTRAGPRLPAEEAAEVGGIGEADRAGHRGHGHPGAGQQPLGL